MKISVTEEDIKNGKVGSSCCPIALAVKRCLPEARKNISVSVNSCYISFLKNDEYNPFDSDPAIRVRMPPAAIKFVFDFNWNNKSRAMCRPFEFELEMPDLEKVRR